MAQHPPAPPAEPRRSMAAVTAALMAGMVPLRDLADRTRTDPPARRRTGG